MLLLGLIQFSCGPWLARKDPAPATPVESIQPARSDPVPAPVDPDTIDVATLGPYFEDIHDGEAHLALAEDRLEDAMRAFDEIAVSMEDPVITPRARFLAVYLAARLGDNARAVEEMPQLAHQLPAVADVAWETAARSAYLLHRFDLAVQLAAEISAEGSLAAAGIEIAADARRRSGKFSEAIDGYLRLLEDAPGEDEARLRFRLVECAADSIGKDGEETDEKAVADALAQIDILRAQKPLGRWTRKAMARETELLAALGKEAKGAGKARPAALDAYEKATVLKNKMKNREAERALNRVLKLARKGGDLACLALFDKGVVIARQRKHGKAGDIFARVARECEDPNLEVKALLQGGKSFMAAQRCEEAISLFEQIEQDHGEHSYADDARLHAANCQLTLGNTEKFDELISSIPDLYPTGDMRAEALWTGALDALGTEQMERAHALMEKYHRLFPVEEGWYTAGRSGYWLGRVEEILGEGEKAAALYEKVVASAPLSHYMVMAHARLAASDPDRAARLMTRLAPPGGKLSTTFDAGLLESYPRLETGIELLRMGLTTKGRRELEILVDTPDTPAEIHWITAALFRRMGQFNAAAAATATVADDWKQRYPSGNDLERWTLAYPIAFEEEVAAASRESGVDRALLWAVMREESGFNSRVESWANAIGLMQLILPTAKAMGRRLEIAVNRKSLKDPATNIRLGAAYLSYLQEKFDGHPVLVIAGYNAGEGAVGRWLEDHPGADLDMFVESIPFKQTRGYTKRVLSSLATYGFLYGENRPVITPPMKLP